MLRIKLNTGDAIVFTHGRAERRLTFAAVHGRQATFRDLHHGDIILAEGGSATIPVGRSSAQLAIVQLGVRSAALALTAPRDVAILRGELLP